MLEQPVHLFLFVKVREGWGDDPERYREMGLEFPKEYSRDVQVRGDRHSLRFAVARVRRVLPAARSVAGGVGRFNLSHARGRHPQPLPTRGRGSHRLRCAKEAHSSHGMDR